MNFSIITPVHRPEFLIDAYSSIVKQSREWEWVILINNGMTMDKLPVEILQDERVRIFKDETGNKNIGYLKKKAFLLGKNDVLVELDSDDMLTPNALEEIETALDDPCIGFVYSDNAKLADKFIPYNPEFGWTKYEEKINDKTLTVMESFEPSSAAMCFIWYAPDHVRAWKKEIYHEIGGHNEELSVCDDHELLIRTYLHTKMKYIPKCLYVYRITGTNTYLERNQLIQKTTMNLFYQYAQRLAERDAELNGLKKIDLGGGIFPREGYEIFDLENGHDLNEGIKLEDNSVGVINATHIIEHLHDKQRTISEIFRVLSDGGWVFIDVPSTDGRGAFMDPTHVSYWNQNSFLYYTNKDQAQYIRNSEIRFQEFNLQTIYPTKWWEDNKIPVTRAWLRAIKSDKKRPHTIKI